MNIKEVRKRAGFNQAELGALVGLDQRGIRRLATRRLPTPPRSTRERPELVLAIREPAG